MDNRRDFPRHDIDWPIFLRSADSNKRIGEMVNISMGGVLMSLTDRVDPAESGHFDLFVCRPRHSAEMLEVQGKTMWTRENDDGSLVGLKIGALDAQGRRTLEDFIEHREELAIELELRS